MWDCRGERNINVVPQLDLAPLGSARWGCRAAGIGEGASLRAFVASCRLRVGPVVGEGQAGPREVAPALRKLRGGAGTCSTVWGLGLQGVCVWCMERLSTRVSTPGAPPVAVATAAAARAARRSRIRWGLFTEAFFLSLYTVV